MRPMASTDLAHLASLPYCYLSTTGRRTGRPHTIEIWFVLQEDIVFLLSGGGRRSDWVRNLTADPGVAVRLGDRTFVGEATVIDDAGEDHPVRRLMAGKYQRWREGRPLSGWARTSLMVRIDLQGASP